MAYFAAKALRSIHGATFAPPDRNRQRPACCGDVFGGSSDAPCDDDQGLRLSPHPALQWTALSIAIFGRARPLEQARGSSAVRGTARAFIAASR